MQQTLGDLQMVIVNDGGDSGTVEELLEARRDQVQGRAKVVHHEAPRGMEAATNTGLRSSDSRFVAVLDDDDTWHPRFLELTVAAMERTGSMGVVTDTEAVYEDIDYGDIRLLDWFLFDPMADVAPFGAAGGGRRPLPPTSLFRLLSGNQFPPCSFVYRREALGEVGYYDESLPVLGDWDFNIRFLLRHDIHYIDEPLAHYHHRKGQSDELGNSAGHGGDLHERVREQLLNRYLRQDIERHSVGIGVLANLLHYLRAQRASALVADHALVTKLDSIERSVGALAESIERSQVGGFQTATSPSTSGLPSES